MAGKQMPGNEGLTSHLAGMSKNQLYDVMSQMKTLIEQNQQQAKQILVENPLLTKALFQAQIMLGMVRPPQVIPNIQQPLSQQPAQAGQQLNAQVAQSLPAHASSSQPQISARQQHPSQSFIPIPPASISPATLSSQSVPSHSQQTAQQANMHLSSQPTSMPVQQSSHMHNPPLHPHHSTPLPSILQSQMPTVSSQAQQSIPPAGNLLQTLQPPLPPLPRPPSMQPFAHQVHSQMGPNLGLQPPQQLLSQPMFHPGANPQVSMGSSFPQGQPPLPSQPPPQKLYQVGSHVGAADFSNQTGGSLQVDRGAPWLPGPLENPSGGTQLPGPPPLPPGQMGSSAQPPPRPPQLTPEMEKALLQQVMSLTPEQINLLPPEQRNQVLQLQQMLR